MRATASSSATGESGGSWGRARRALIVSFSVVLWLGVLPHPSGAASGTGGSAAALKATTSVTSRSTAPVSTTTSVTSSSTEPVVPGASAAGAGTASSPRSVPAPTTNARAGTHGAGTVPSTPAIALAVLAAVLVLLSLGWALARAFAYEPSWMPSLRHCLAEAGFRASATFAELGDWLRLGR